MDAIHFARSRPIFGATSLNPSASAKNVMFHAQTAQVFPNLIALNAIPRPTSTTPQVFLTPIVLHVTFLAMDAMDLSPLTALTVNQNTLKTHKRLEVKPTVQINVLLNFS